MMFNFSFNEYIMCDQKSLGYTLDILNKATTKQTSLENEVKKRISRANHHGRRLFLEFEGFQATKATSYDAGVHECIDRDLHRAEILAAKATVFDQDSSLFSSGKGSVQTDMQKMRQVGQDVLEAKHLQQLLRVHWFTSALARVRESMRRLGNQCPPCCIKFLIVMEKMICLDFVITVEIFFRSLLSVIFVKDDFRKNMVHQMLDIVRDGLGISPEDFVNFLEANELQVSPDLMSLVRNSNTFARPKPPRTSKSAIIASSSTSSADVLIVTDIMQSPSAKQSPSISPVLVEHKTIAPPRRVFFPEPEFTSSDLLRKDGLLISDEAINGKS
jgi:hypothetical protein